MTTSPPIDPSLALLTDLYQLTMAYGHHRLGRADDEAVFHLFFRRAPFGGGYTVAAGLGPVIDYLRAFAFADDDLAYLATLSGNDGAPLFDEAFLRHLGDLRLSCDVDAVPEGTVVFPQQPLVRVRGPLLEAQLLETALLNLVNFSSLVATKAARVVAAARGEPVLEFGLRRAQGPDGALTASRAAFVGGCAATSNVLAGKRLGIPVRGTHAHSWVMAFDGELEAFDAYARALPNNCVFLVDTYDTIEGVRHAIEVGRRLRERGHELAGVRLDSGDLAYLSAEARRMLDEAGFPRAAIIASNDLDEHIIESLKQQGAKVGVWGVGTKLVTAYDQPALGGVYKLAAIRRPGSSWRYKLKLSEQTAKISTPGVLQVRRFTGEEGFFLADMIYDVEKGAPAAAVVVDPTDPLRQKAIPEGTPHEDLLVPIFRGGRLVYDPPSLPAIRERAFAELARLHPTIRRSLNPHEYPAGFEKGLHELRTALVLAARGRAS